MLVLGSLFQIAGSLAQFLALPFPAFALSFALAGTGIVFQVYIIYIHKDFATVNIPFLLTRSSLPLRLASSQLFKRTLNTNRVLCRLHLVHLPPNTRSPTQHTDVIYNP